MTDWLLDTLLWTAILIALVLLVRRPVARWFGPQIAYALWAIPMVRLVLPPLHLPDWLATVPAGAPTSATASATAQALSFLTPHPATSVATPEAVTGSLPGSGSAAPGEPASWTLHSLFETAPLIELALLVWLTGAAIFLYLRFAAYFRLRRDLLADAREVGRAGKVRLVETPATATPLAFGVRDPVIALPPGFLAQQGRTARDLALAHELEHHHGRDLLINVAVQPLFALHWWNPLGRYGWLALRRDQEAACDARVIASQPAEARAAYARVIAGFAAGPNLALAAPMACPVLGEKSIIQRLRSLKMSDTSPRRRFAGRAMLGAAVLALPLTASISYAEATAPQPPSAPSAPDVAIAPPVPAEAPRAPAAPILQEMTTIDPDAEVNVESREDTTTIVIKRKVESDGESGKEKRIEKIRIINNGEKMSDEQLDKMLKELRAGREDAEAKPGHPARSVTRMRFATQEGDERQQTMIRFECDEVQFSQGGETGAIEEVVCKSNVTAGAIQGLERARAEVAATRNIDARIRDQILEELDRQIEAWKKTKG